MEPVDGQWRLWYGNESIPQNEIGYKENEMRPTALLNAALTALMVVALTAGCARGTDTSPAVSLEGTSWTLVELEGKALIEETEITMEFEEGQVGGRAGCNRYFGTPEREGDKVSFGTVGSTEMACVAPKGVMTQETTFLKVLGSVVTLEMENGGLAFLNAAGQKILVFTPAAD